MRFGDSRSRNTERATFVRRSKIPRTTAPPAPRFAISVVVLLLASPALGVDVPFGAQQVLTSAFTSASAVHAADLDGDGDLDAVAAAFTGDTVLWLENDGSSPPAFTPRVISATANGARAVFAADLDGDGDIDVLSASSVDRRIAWYENDGASPPGFTTRTIDSGMNGANSVFAIDFDGDGDTDVLATAEFDLVRWYENDGAALPVFTIRTIDTPNIPSSVTAADVDGDGDLDAIATRDTGVEWYESDGASPPSFTTRTVESDGGGFWITTADMDRDGDLDLISATGSVDNIAWHENDGASPPVFTRHQISSAGVFLKSVVTVDFDMDGDLDVLSCESQGNIVRWHENTAGDGTAWTTRTLSTAVFGPVSVWAADVDGDGDPDAISASSSDNKISWYENESIHRSAAFPDSKRLIISPAGEIPYSVFAADVDGDGDLDALVYSPSSGGNDNVAWYENTDGAGGFGPQRLISTSVTGNGRVFAVDVDVDGDMDALSAATGNGGVAWYENVDGAGTFAAQQTISANAANEIFAADVDGDGDPDVLASSAQISWYENTDGAGTFGPEQVIAVPPCCIQKLVFAGDLDGDGDVDALSVGANSGIRWYENTAGDGSAWSTSVISSLSGTGESGFAADL
ncbi:MAG: VCBS repeat-containing protein, partial [Deltaproteobacteria bacterium]|nr:VCBS repeat-containing protein [Deltaproteobacteria bacterium]